MVSPQPGLSLFWLEAMSYEVCQVDAGPSFTSAMDMTLRGTGTWALESGMELHHRS